MQLNNTHTTYGAVTKFLHWLVALCVILLLIVGFIMDDIADKSLKLQVYNIHKLLGLGVLCLMIIRLIWRFISIQPGYPDKMPRWEKRAARLVHDVLYLVLFVMPLSGWIMSSAAGHAPHIGNWTLNAPGVSHNLAFRHYASTLHYCLAFAIPAIIGLHLAAAIKHHLWDKNNVLLRMLPGVKIKE